MYKNLDNNISNFAAQMELDLLEIKCGLNHGCNYEDNPFPIDYICQPIGNQKLNIKEAVLRIPVCASCLASLYSEYQLLMYCVECNSSQWIFLPEAKYVYDKDKKIIFLTACPKCYQKDQEEPYEK